MQLGAGRRSRVSVRPSAIVSPNVSVTSRRSAYSRYSKDLASFAMTAYNPKDAEGFINLFALPVQPLPARPAGGPAQQGKAKGGDAK